MEPTMTWLEPLYPKVGQLYLLYIKTNQGPAYAIGTYAGETDGLKQWKTQGGIPMEAGLHSTIKAMSPIVGPGMFLQ